MNANLTPTQFDALRAELDRQFRKLQRSMRTTSRAMKPVQLDQSTVRPKVRRRGNRPPFTGAVRARL